VASMASMFNWSAADSGCNPGRSSERETCVTNNGRQIVFVLGMHRSGTSALTGALTLLGAPKPATPMADQEENAKGFFESIPVMEINDAILAAGGSAWDDWGPIALMQGPTKETREQIQAVLRQEFGDAPFVALKDPRICRLLPWWAEAAEATGLTCHAVLPYRHPLEVAESLHIRNGLSIAEGILLWLRYVLDAEYASRGIPRAFITMAELLENWRGCLQGVALKLGIDWPVSVDAASKKIQSFLDADLRHQRRFADTLATHPLLVGWAASAYGGLEALRRGDTVANRKALDRVREEFDRVSRLVAPAAKAAVARHTAMAIAEADAGRRAAEESRSADIEAAVRAAVEAQGSALQQGRADLLDALDRTHRARAEADANVARLTEELTAQRRALADARKAAARIEAQRIAEAESFMRALADIRSENASHISELQRILDEDAKVQAQTASRIDDLQHTLAAEIQRQEVESQAMQARVDALQAELEARDERLKQYREAGSGEFLAWALRRTDRP